ncbi:hypothetical protein E0Z10_g929 [Xylaria hypoxylon]|uniref:Uncharacterized protein n=1 Tax=Xylaria hypoxylon TaxID=37992 RepID=A0A4Z0Z7R5_9PEZI|nr:hypothetical protein E0Z10_g929 [Xylaria hypoxylon]
MSNDPTFLEAFGEPGFFRTAFGYDLTQIKAWLQACCTGGKGGSRTTDLKVQALLKQVYEMLSLLIVPDGAEFLKPEPKSHFFRTTNSDWLDKGKNSDREETLSIFNLCKWELEGKPFLGVFEQAADASWWHPCDLLGLFLSILGPAPPGASKENYFIPLTAVYGQWCTHLAGKSQNTDKVGTGWLPAVFQATWRQWRPDGSKLSDRIDFFLGSSLALDDYKEEETGQWKSKVQRARFDMFYNSLRIKLFKQTDFDSKLSPVQYTRNRLGGQTFGNCGETYPLLVSIKRYDHCALCPPQLLHFVNGALVSPCLNCQQLITYSGALRDNFHMKTGDNWGPKTAQQKAEEMAEATTTTEEPVMGETIQPSAVDSPPEGWSTNADDIDTDFYWGTDGDGKAAAAKVGLANPTPQMIVDRYNGSDACVFTTPDNKVYLWNMITQEVYEFTKPTALNDILAQLRLPSGKGSVELKLLKDAP